MLIDPPFLPAPPPPHPTTTTAVAQSARTNNTSRARISMQPPPLWIARKATPHFCAKAPARRPGAGMYRRGRTGRHDGGVAATAGGGVARETAKTQMEPAGTRPEAEALQDFFRPSGGVDNDRGVNLRWSVHRNGPANP